MKVIGISDIHGYLPELPSCDVVCIAGDILPLEIQRNFKASWVWLLEDFTNWANALDCKHVVFIAGNHDFVFSECGGLGMDMRNLWKDSNKIHYLQDSSIEIDGFKFYGTPWIPVLCGWAFYLDSARLTDKFNEIPNCDVLLTHCPPRLNNAGKVLQAGYNYGRDFGCEELRIALRDRDVKWALSGHVHSGEHDVTYYDHTILSGPHTSKIISTNIVNVSIKDEDYKVTYKPFEFEL